MSILKFQFPFFMASAARGLWLWRKQYLLDSSVSLYLSNLFVRSRKKNQSLSLPLVVESYWNGTPLIKILSGKTILG